MGDCLPSSYGLPATYKDWVGPRVQPYMLLAAPNQAMDSGSVWLQVLRMWRMWPIVKSRGSRLPAT